jgi:hypothetical protein
MDFIVELSESNGFNGILMCVDCFIKMAHICPTMTSVTSESVAELYLRYVFNYHSLPTDIVADRSTQFVSCFSQRLYDFLKAIELDTIGLSWDTKRDSQGRGGVEY